MIRYILIGGYIHKAQDGGKAFCETLTKDITDQPLRILDCLFARDRDIWEERFKDDEDFFLRHIKDVEVNLATPENFIEQIRNSNIVVFQGGVPRKLISELDGTGDWLKELDGKMLVGSSGGADAICKYYGVGKTMNIGEGLGLLPVKFIPHWKSDYAPGIAIDWDVLLENLRSYKEELDIITLGNGEFTVIEI